MLKKRLSETVTSLLYSTAHSSTRSIPRHKQPWTQKPNRTQTCSAIRLTTHLDLTFLKTSSTYSEGCNRGKTPALHIKKHSETNMCLTVHFTQLKKNAVTSCEMDKSLWMQQRPPLQHQSAASLEVLPRQNINPTFSGYIKLVKNTLRKLNYIPVAKLSAS